MAVIKLFVLGLPGSGKSSVAHYISMHARDRWWSTTHINDYDILYQMFREDTQGQFKSADFGGFDVLDLSTFDTALKKLERQVNRYFSAKSDEIILIEFSRNDYTKALHQFSNEFLHDAYFLYLDAEIDTCKRRILHRVANPTNNDDHYVSDYIFETYYNNDNGQYIPYILERDFGIDQQRSMMIDNNYTLQEASSIISSFIDSMLASMLSHHLLVA
jgi:adenylate kinase family enzyme